MGTKALILIFLLAGAIAAEAQGRPPLVPANWIEEPRQSTSDPLRFNSPDGTAWITLHATPAGKRDQGKAKIVLADGERLTYERSTSRFVAVSGFRGDRIFYRKSNLACGGSRWHHISLEYAAEDKRKMDNLVTRVAHGMNRYDSDCRGSSTTTAGGLIRNR